MQNCKNLSPSAQLPWIWGISLPAITDNTGALYFFRWCISLPRHPTYCWLFSWYAVSHYQELWKVSSSTWFLTGTASLTQRCVKKTLWQFNVMYCMWLRNHWRLSIMLCKIHSNACDHWNNIEHQSVQDRTRQRYLLNVFQYFCDFVHSKVYSKVLPINTPPDLQLVCDMYIDIAIREMCSNIFDERTPVVVSQFKWPCIYCTWVTDT